MNELTQFRDEARTRLEKNCPPLMCSRIVKDEKVNSGRKKPSTNPESYAWLERMRSRRWTMPIWPIKYGSANLSKYELAVLVTEL